MSKTATVLTLIGITLTIPHLSGLAASPLRVVTQTQANLGFDNQIWRELNKPGDRAKLLAAIDHSLRYLKTPAAIERYHQYPIPEITHERVRRSLERFRQLLKQAKSPAELQAVVKREFVFYQSVGQDNRGTVAFTGYFEPTYKASRVRTSAYRYPLYRLPANFAQWPHPHPTRAQLEGTDGLQGSQGPLRGLELLWLRDRLEAFLIQVQGSARLQMTNGRTMTVGYAGKTDQPYSGVGKELVKDGKMRLEDLTLPTLIQYFRQHPEAINQYLPRNRSFVFFRETGGVPATGYLGVPVTAGRSIATDKSIMPPGALTLIQTQIPYSSALGQLENRLVSRYVLNQDTGSAIQGPGRVDIFMGTGPQAEQLAGRLVSTGQLYYLLLKN